MVLSPNNKNKSLIHIELQKKAYIVKDFEVTICCHGPTLLEFKRGGRFPNFKIIFNAFFF